MVQLKFTSIGAGYFPIHYAFCVKLPEHGDRKILDVQPDVWDNNLILQIDLSDCNFEQYMAGLNETDLKEFCHKPLLVGGTLDKDNNLDESIQVEVTAASEKQVNIQLTNTKYKKSNDTETQSSGGEDAPKIKKNKRKNKKRRSYSESHCDELKAVLMENPLPPLTEEQIVVNSTTKSIDIKKSINGVVHKNRTLSESSNDDQIVPKLREIKSILKRRSSFNRSISESSVDDHFYSCSMDIAVGSIPEEDGDKLSESCKKTVRFDNNIRKQLYR